MDGSNHVPYKATELVVELGPGTHGVALSVADGAEGPSLKLRLKMGHYTW